jgi:hypothetical protein
MVAISRISAARAAIGLNKSDLRLGLGGELADAAHLVGQLADLLARSSCSPACKVKVRTAKGDVFAAYRFRLFSEDGKRQLTTAEFDTLPWGGAGRDPLLGKQPMKELA